MDMTKTELKKIIEQHELWLKTGGQEGKLAVLKGADLSGAILTEVNFIGADLSGAILVGADLRGTKLEFADLAGADLTGAKRTA